MLFSADSTTVVEHINWPLVPDHSAGITALAHCKESVYGKQMVGWTGAIEPDDLEEVDRDEITLA